MKPTLLLCTTILSLPALAQGPPLPDRVAARRSVEDVLWRHRIWPQENATPKPPLSAVLPDAEIAAAVMDDLRKSQALAVYWKRPVTAAMLDAELARMTRGSRAPDVLTEMLAAVGDDPELAREAIARPALVDRLIRSWYAHDARIHGDLERRAEAGLGATLSETTWSRREMDAEDWTELVASMKRLAVSGTVDEADAFRAYSVRESTDDVLRVGVASWPKRTFDSWWSESRSAYAPSLEISKGDAPAQPASNTPGSCTNDTWHALGDVTPMERHSHTAVWTGTEMIVWGGSTPVASAVDTGGRYEPATDSWYAISATGAPSARTGHRAVWTGTEMIVWGGQQARGTSTPIGTGARYAPATDTWSPMTHTVEPEARQEFTMVWAGSRAIIWGGRGIVGDLNNGSSYNPAIDSWAPTSTTGAPVARHGHVAVWTGSTMVVWSGSEGGSVSTGGRYDPLSDTWSPVSTTGAPQKRSDATAVWTGSVMVVWGGNSSGGGLLGTGGRYDPAANAWSDTTTTLAPAGRFYHTAVWTGSRMLIWGGRLNAGGETAEGGSYDPAGDSWTSTATSGAPHSRRWHSAVWTGSEMLVWGGVWELIAPPNLLTYLNSGGRYAPATDSWVPTSVRTVGPPQARERHSVVWTGSEAIFWGGQGVSGVLDDGARYTAATDSWWPTSLAGAPSARREQVAVWTGTEMFLWGGEDASFNKFNTGGRYQPASDTWSPVSTTQAPTGRSGHTAVWTGSRAIVWGGESTASESTGGRYDPATDTWAPTSTGANVPAQRSWHAAIWTGTRMVVWGGDETGAGSIGTGGRYDPVADTWTPTSNVGAPSRRASFASAWTGTRMLVWGGRDPNALGDGASYDPSGDSWSPMTATAAPTARAYPSSAWTGSEMLVWAGSADGGAVNTGGRYLPSANTWAPMSTVMAPSARFRHAAVWAGDKMVVFGGFTLSGTVSGTGASYCACRMFWFDNDGDGYGNGDGGAPTMETCDGTTPAGWVDNGGDCWDANPNVHPGVVDNSCNGVDDDCNGSVDDLWIGGLSQCGLGVCHAFGTFECVNGSVVNNCTPGPPNSSTDDVCNNLDDDCNGATDEDFLQREDHWIATANGPQTRTNQTTVWTGSEVIVFGGDNGSGTVKAGGEAYAWGADTWRNLAAGPAKRWHHTAVWTGSRMVVWGGDDNVATVYNTGSRYDPSTDTWAATTTTGAPSARGGHTAVWASPRVIVWGGRDPVTFYNNGARYDPVANSWITMATAGAPGTRWLHTAVWTGTEMIVWGGQNDPGTGLVALRSGGKYNPTSNTWAATSLSGAPSVRYGHVAAWIGSEMVIWGGTDGGSYLPNGARYNPTSNTWTAISATGAPSARAFASAEWTGTELIIWGGTNGSPLADGARYNPATDTWTQMNPFGAPAARLHASSAWTGTELIVWGGDPNGAAKNDGARYLIKTLCGTGGCQRTGLSSCSGGVVSFQCTPAQSQPEICDGIDNNCNVAIDDGIPVPSGQPLVLATRLDGMGTTQISWGATLDTTGYDVTRGSISVLRGTAGDYTASTNLCLANDASPTSVNDFGAPSPGDGVWYLVRPVNACSGNGTYNEPSSPPQSGSRDAEIAASPSACP